MNKLIMGKIGALVAAIALASTSAYGGFSWVKIPSSSGATDVSSQIKMDVVTGTAGNNVDFVFQNIGSVSCFMAEINFDTGLPLGSFTFASPTWNTPTGEVSFNQDSNPNIPNFGMNTVGFIADLGVSSVEPGSKWGINNTLLEGTEMLRLHFNLGTGGFQDVINAINSGSFRVAVHMQGIPVTGGTMSDGYVTGAVPEPTTIVAGLLLLVPLGLSTVRQLRRRN